MRKVVGTNFVQDLAGFGLAALVPFEIFRKISQNFFPGRGHITLCSAGDAH